MLCLFKLIKNDLNNEKGFLNISALLKKKDESIKSNISTIKTLTYEDVSHYMSRETFNYIKGLMNSNKKVCIAHVFSDDLQSIFENGLYLNGRGMSMGYDDIDFKKAFELQDREALGKGEESYLQTMRKNGQPLTIEGIMKCFGYDEQGRIDNKKIAEVLASLRAFKEVSLESAMYYDIRNEEELFNRIRAASYGKTEGGNLTDGVLVLKLPVDLQSEYVTKDSNLVHMVRGTMSLRPNYIEGFIPVSPDGKVGQIIYRKSSWQVNDTNSSQVNLSVSNIKQIIETLKSKYNWSESQAISYLSSVINSGQSKNITRDGGARKIFLSMSQSEMIFLLNQYIEQQNDSKPEFTTKRVR